MNSAVYDIITERIVSMLNEGVCPWRRPWNKLNAYPQNYVSGRTYHGFNFLILALIGYEIPYFLTYKQATEKGGAVKKGEKGMPIIYWQLLKSKTKTDTKGEPKKIPLIRYYTVFNAAQIEGIEFPTVTSRTGFEFNPIAQAEKVVAGFSGPKIEHGFNSARYYPATDTLQMPSPGSFDTPADYYATLFHELGHATGHASRLSRRIDNSFGTPDYSREELIAEMTSAFLCAHCGIDNSTTERTTAYLASWIKALKGDSRLVVTAASAAQRAANLILGLTPTEMEADPNEVFPSKA
jgi:antirestriction protein ArdC